MKLFITLLIILFSQTSFAQSPLAIAKVDQVDGVYVFIKSKPVAKYEVLGSVQYIKVKEEEGDRFAWEVLADWGVEQYRRDSLKQDQRNRETSSYMEWAEKNNIVPMGRAEDGPELEDHTTLSYTYAIMLRNLVAEAKRFYPEANGVIIVNNYADAILIK